MKSDEILLTEVLEEVSQSEIAAVADSNRQVSKQYGENNEGAAVVRPVQLVMVAHDLEGELY